MISIDKQKFSSNLSRVFALNGLSSLLSLERSEKLYALTLRMLEENEKYNLTTILEEREVFYKHFLDSVLPLSMFDLPENASVIDVGTGAGFPGLVLKTLEPSLELTLLDSLGKRMNWLEQILPQLGVEAECITARAEEEALLRRERYDVATSRAVARLPILLELTAPYVKVGGAVLAMKGTAAQEELEEAKNAIRKLGLKLERVAQFPIDDTAHTVIVLKKISATPAQYPRRYAKIKQAPL